MLLEVFTVLLMKKILFKIFFQNKYYERRREVCFPQRSWIRPVLTPQAQKWLPTLSLKHLCLAALG